MPNRSDKSKALSKTSSLPFQTGGAKARYVLNLYLSSPAPSDTHYRDLVRAVPADLDRLSGERPD